jgi:hypothetical protein
MDADGSNQTLTTITYDDLQNKLRVVFGFQDRFIARSGSLRRVISLSFVAVTDRVALWTEQLRKLGCRQKTAWRG